MKKWSIIVFDDTKKKFDAIKAVMSSRKKKDVSQNEALDELCESWLGVVEEI